MPYPEQMDLMRDLVVNDHAHLEDEPLVLAIYFASRTVPNEECLFEVMYNFGMNEVSEDNTIFQVQFGNAPKLPLPVGRRLRLFISNPTEMRRAIQERWSEVEDLQQALAAGQAVVLYEQGSAAEAHSLLAALREAPVEAAA